MEPHKPDSRWWLAAWLAALLLVILGAKLWTIQVYGSPLPYWDQWDEAKLVFQPWLEGHLTWGALFAAHNEHRILFTRLLDLLELRLNGQWDPGLQMVVNALLHAGFACGLAFCLWVFLGKRREGLICVSARAFFCAAVRRGEHDSRVPVAGIFSVRFLSGGHRRIGDSERRGRPGGGWDWPPPFWLCSPWPPACWRR